MHENSQKSKTSPVVVFARRIQVRPHPTSKWSTATDIAGPQLICLSIVTIFCIVAHNDDSWKPSRSVARSMNVASINSLLVLVFGGLGLGLYTTVDHSNDYRDMALFLDTMALLCNIVMTTVSSDARAKWVQAILKG
jgi:hypothetical protein